MSNTLIVNFSFNFPEISIVGPIRENTIEKLNQVLPVSTTSTRSARAGNPKFAKLTAPHAHWSVKLDGQYCDQVGICNLFMQVLDALEEEGGWKLASTHALTFENQGAIQQESVEQYKFFFSRIL
eukprot:CAMPEP_0176438156 /NCGR_PEP_ID=MMETSP0127-20121128/19106_1 /TAXON_ID=938130 /ORGANISM="Platyophrya macrostoma, Strain WH" /LENGTH=124 /DNA_ID=CAMNT_0017822033 /DNA_START=44 /DNA_END=418 /DNA_ORIENTATION=+